MARINFGILSTANIARKALIPAIERSYNAQVLGVASGSGKAESFAAELNIPKFYNTYEDLLDDPEIDAVYIPLPNQLHKKWTIEAAKRGKHVLCEKPAALSVEEIKEMVAVCRENNVVFMEAFMYHFHPQHKRVKEIITNGEIGDVNLIKSTFSFPLEMDSNNIRLNPELGGGVVYDVGCYCIHATRMITGEEPVKVSAFSLNHPGTNVDTTVCGLLSFESGILASFDCSFEQQLVEQYEVIGTKGSIFVKHAFRPDREGACGLIKVTSEAGEREEIAEGDQYALQVEHFAECILNGAHPVYGGEETIKNMQVIERVLAELK
ncbi:Gfo/Idh/MocA family protein [Ferdinandcohnia quinoae]|uniref:Gfo/Idh/MocA family oxidoreductase n=1 Tax=Fredinandcohnia quinoae TaxID=2918902 RepID=A0AAW5EEP9_9BACI|nr:Gfo/Idh/MocA family oxidoreductase [Fredinandcohnia sp. SECRCQ15]MCH1627986.1 Gfo/Idh/MocA family oxidoreductase [Fredinandcohnia sp. SECRCQ15]